MDLRTVRYEVADDGVATVWLNRPDRHNAWTGRMHTEYRWVFAQLEADAHVRCAIVTGAGRAFSVGGDGRALAGHAERGGYDAGTPDVLAEPGHGVHPELDHDVAWQLGVRFPIIAAVNGACAGIALALVCFCDLRFAARGAKLTTAATKLGLPVEYGLSWILPRLVGVTHAADLIYTSRAVAAQDAPHGLFNAVVPASELMDHVRRYAHDLATLAGPEAVASSKRLLVADLLRHAPGTSVEESKALLDRHMGTAEYREGVAAFREKRRPSF
jgi:enoyl-CoA hydratase/carnithine racemase